MIHEVLPKFTKILSHEYLEPYGILEPNFNMDKYGSYVILN